MKSTLTPEQSQRLIELGVDQSKASMCILYFPESDSSEPLEAWQIWEEDGKLLCNPDESQVQDVECIIAPKDADYDQSAKEEHPIFTLSDILSLLPKELTTELDREIVRFQLYLYIYEEKWCVGYGENERERPKDRLFDDSPWLNLTWIWRPELTDALFELLCWCITNKHLKV